LIVSDLWQFAKKIATDTQQFFFGVGLSKTAMKKNVYNYIKQGRLIFKCAKEKCYCKENPFEVIKFKMKPQNSAQSYLRKCDKQLKIS